MRSIKLLFLAMCEAIAIAGVLLTVLLLGAYVVLHTMTYQPNPEPTVNPYSPPVGTQEATP